MDNFPKRRDGGTAMAENAAEDALDSRANGCDVKNPSSNLLLREFETATRPEFEEVA